MWNKKWTTGFYKPLTPTSADASALCVMPWKKKAREMVLVGCLTSQQHASVSQGRIYVDNCTSCHTQIEVADQTCYLIQSQYTEKRPTSPRADPITPADCLGNHGSTKFGPTAVTGPRKSPRVKVGIKPRSATGAVQRVRRDSNLHHALLPVTCPVYPQLGVRLPLNFQESHTLGMNFDLNFQVKCIVIPPCRTWSSSVLWSLLLSTIDEVSLHYQSAD